jgi:hypothetical protein
LPTTPKNHLNKKHTPESLLKMSKVHKGQISPMKGRHHVAEALLKMSKAHKGKQIGNLNPFYGKHHSEETKKKMSEAKKGIKKGPMKQNQKNSISKSISGIKHPFFGKKHTDKSKLKMSKSAKGRIPWHKGLTMETDDRVRKNIENRKK